MTPLLAVSDEPVDFLRHKSGVHKSRLGAARIGDILLIDDSQMDARAISALLRTAFGRDVTVRHATTLLRAKNMLLEGKPDLIVLDDIIPPKDRAERSMQLLREAGFDKTIIVVSGEMNRLRRLELLRAGAAAVIHKDDLNASSLAEAVNPPAGQRDDTVFLSSRSDHDDPELEDDETSGPTDPTA